MTTSPTLEAMVGNPPVPISAKLVYRDVVHARFKPKLSDQDLAFLGKHSGSFKFETDRTLPGWPYRLVLNQPDDDALRHFDKKFGKTVLINRIESSLDLVTDTMASAEALKRHIERHLVQKSRRARQLGWAGSTSYWRTKRWVTRQPVVYIPADGSKVANGAPCSHIEIRVCGVRAVRGAGVYPVRDLIGFDHRGLWQRSISLTAIDLAGLGRAQRYANGDKRRKLPDADFDERTGRAMALAARQYDTDGKPRRADLTVQEIIDKYRDKLDLRPALVSLDREWLLPEAKP